MRETNMFTHNFRWKNNVNWLRNSRQDSSTSEAGLTATDGGNDGVDGNASAVAAASTGEATATAVAATADDLDENILVLIKG